MNINTEKLTHIAAECGLYEDLSPEDYQAALVKFAEKVVAYRALLTSAEEKQ